MNNKNNVLNGMMTREELIYYANADTFTRGLYVYNGFIFIVEYIGGPRDNFWAVAAYEEDGGQYKRKLTRNTAKGAGRGDATIMVQDMAAELLAA